MSSTPTPNTSTPPANLIHYQLMKYDFFIAGRWRNRDQVQHVTDIVRQAGFTAFCFLENDYTEVLDQLGLGVDAMESNNTESLPLDHPLIQAIFDKDIAGQRDSDNLLVVLPAGIAAHMEAGISYGMGKKCYALGTPEKTETLYSIFEQIFDSVESLQTWLAKSK